LHYNVPWAEEARVTYKTMFRLAQLLLDPTEKYEVDIQKHRLLTS